MSITKPPSDPTPGRSALSSFFSACVGWTAINLTWYIRSLSKPPEANWALPLYATASAIVIFFVWLTLLFPLYYNVSPQSLLWRWYLCTLCGSLVATLIACVVFFLISPRLFAMSLPGILLTALYTGSLVGGSTCLFGSLTAPIFRGEVRFDPTYHRVMQWSQRVKLWIKDRFTKAAGQ